MGSFGESTEMMFSALELRVAKGTRLENNNFRNFISLHFISSFLPRIWPRELNVSEGNSFQVFTLLYVWVDCIKITIDILQEKHSLKILQTIIIKLTVCIGSSSSFFLFLLKMVGRGLVEFMFLDPRILALRLAGILKIKQFVDLNSVLLNIGYKKTQDIN